MPCRRYYMSGWGQAMQPRVKTPPHIPRPRNSQYSATVRRSASAPLTQPPSSPSSPGLPPPSHLLLCVPCVPCSSLLHDYGCVCVCLLHGACACACAFACVRACVRLRVVSYRVTAPKKFFLSPPLFFSGLRTYTAALPRCQCGVCIAWRCCRCIHGPHRLHHLQRQCL